MQQYRGTPDLNQYIQGNYALYAIPQVIHQDAPQAIPQNYPQTVPQGLPQVPNEGVPIINKLVPFEDSVIDQRNIQIPPFAQPQPQPQPQAQPIQIVYQIPQPQPPPLPQTPPPQSNIRCWKYGFQILFYIFISFSRFGFIISLGILPPVILWIVADLLFITATFFICCSQLLTKYRIFIGFCIACFIIDLAGLVYTGIYLGINTSSNQTSCNQTSNTNSNTQLSTTGYIYDISYINNNTEDIETCDDTTNTTKDYTTWLIIIPITSVIMYLFFLCLFCCTQSWRNQFDFNQVNPQQPSQIQENGRADPQQQFFGNGREPMIQSNESHHNISAVRDPNLSIMHPNPALQLLTENQ